MKTYYDNVNVFCCPKSTEQFIRYQGPTCITINNICIPLKKFHEAIFLAQNQQRGKRLGEQDTDTHKYCQLLPPPASQHAPTLLTFSPSPIPHTVGPFPTIYSLTLADSGPSTGPSTAANHCTGRLMLIDRKSVPPVERHDQASDQSKCKIMSNLKYTHINMCS